MRSSFGSQEMLSRLQVEIRARGTTYLACGTWQALPHWSAFAAAGSPDLGAAKGAIDANQEEQSGSPAAEGTSLAREVGCNFSPYNDVATSLTGTPPGKPRSQSSTR